MGNRGSDVKGSLTGAQVKDLAGRCVRPGDVRCCHPGLLPEAKSEGGATPVYHAVGYVGGGDLTVQVMLAHLLAKALAQRCWEVPLQLAGEIGVLRSVGGQ